jgi:sec-independent protein translocase protein TatA
MPSLGPMELILIFLIVIILFGSSRLAGIGKGLGEGIRNFKKGMKGDEPERLEEKPDTRNV